MKIRFLCLLLVIAGIIVISGCVDKETQPLTSKAPENLYRSIFYPYTGFPDDAGPEMPYVHSNGPSERPGYEPSHNLRDATSLLDRNIEKAEKLSLRLEEGVQHYKAEGKDVSELEALLEKYNFLIEEAKKYRNLADAAVYEENSSSIKNSGLENNTSENTRVEYLIMSQKSMMEANNVLRDIFNEFQRQMPGSAEVNSTSKLNASGEGMVSLFGNFTLMLHLEEGDLVIPYLSPDSEINVTGDYVFEEDNEMQDGLLLYHINSADVKISGSRKTVQLRGVNITLNVSNGEGSAVFLGNGTYRIENAGIIKEQKWANPPFPKEGTNHHKHDHDEKDNNDKATGHRIRSDMPEETV
jgi:hypothetical protein